MQRTLSPAQRKLLLYACKGASLPLLLAKSPRYNATSKTIQALHRHGMVAGIDHAPTAKGLAYFQTPAPSN